MYCHCPRGWSDLPGTCASRALSTPEANYCILGTSMGDQLFPHTNHSVVAVLTDHSAVKAVLQTPNPTRKYKVED